MSTCGVLGRPYEQNVPSDWRSAEVAESSSASDVAADAIDDAVVVGIVGVDGVVGVVGEEGEGGTPKSPPPPDDVREREGEVATKTRRETKRPDRFKVLLYNDNYTPMEFVVMLLEQVFQKSPAASTQLMLQIHRAGMGVAGVFVLEIAETKVVTVHRMAEERGYPLRAGVEKE
jgi:ATP-dependent Clp protease adaptor protein ClpS